MITVICKRIDNGGSPDGGQARYAHDLLGYMESPQARPDHAWHKALDAEEAAQIPRREKCVGTVSAGFSAPGLPAKAMAAEMAADCLLSKRLAGGQGIDHWVLSLKRTEGEDVGKDELFRAARAWIGAMGYAEGHKWTASAHADTDNLHVHIAVCRMNYLTEKVSPHSGWKIRNQRAIAKVARELGWSLEQGSLKYAREDGCPEPGEKPTRPAVRKTISREAPETGPDQDIPPRAPIPSHHRSGDGLAPSGPGVKVRLRHDDHPGSPGRHVSQRENPEEGPPIPPGPEAALSGIAEGARASAPARHAGESSVMAVFSGTPEASPALPPMPVIPWPEFPAPSAQRTEIGSYVPDIREFRVKCVPITREEAARLEARGIKVTYVSREEWADAARRLDYRIQKNPGKVPDELRRINADNVDYCKREGIGLWGANAPPKPHSPSEREARFEERTGLKSGKRVLHDELAAIHAAIRDELPRMKWGQIHAVLAAHGIAMERREHGSRFGIVFSMDGRNWQPASKVCPMMAWSALNGRIGAKEDSWRDANDNARELLEKAWASLRHVEVAPPRNGLRASAISAGKLAALHRISPDRARMAAKRAGIGLAPPSPKARNGLDVFIFEAGLPYAKAAEAMASAFPELGDADPDSSLQEAMAEADIRLAPGSREHGAALDLVRIWQAMRPESADVYPSRHWRHGAGSALTADPPDIRLPRRKSQLGDILREIGSLLDPPSDIIPDLGPGRACVWLAGADEGFIGSHPPNLLQGGVPPRAFWVVEKEFEDGFYRDFNRWLTRRRGERPMPLPALGLPVRAASCRKPVEMEGLIRGYRVIWLREREMAERSKPPERIMIPRWLGMLAAEAAIHHSRLSPMRRIQKIAGILCRAGADRNEAFSWMLKSGLDRKAAAEMTDRLGARLPAPTGGGRLRAGAADRGREAFWRDRTRALLEMRGRRPCGGKHGIRARNAWAIDKMITRGEEACRDGSPSLSI